MSVGYQHKEAIACMVDAVPTVSTKATGADVLRLLSETNSQRYASISYIYVLSLQRTLVGVVSITDVMRHAKSTLVASIMTEQPVAVPPTMKAEEVALTAIEHNLKAVPVVDTTGRLLGVVTSDTVRDILHYGRLHDALRHAGVHVLEDPKESLINGTPWFHIKRRFPWLLLGLVGGLLAAFVVQQFESALSVHVLLVAFIPLVVYLADAVGSQTEIIFVRAVALDPSLGTASGFRTYFLREVVVSGVLAVILGGLVSAVAMWWFAVPSLVPLLFTAIVTTLLLAMVVALVIPYIATRLRYDPALTSGPVATVIRDVMTLVVYFMIVAWFL